MHRSGGARNRYKLLMIADMQMLLSLAQSSDRRISGVPRTLEEAIDFQTGTVEKGLDSR